MVPTCATSALSSTGRAAAWISAMTLVTARSIPRLRSIGFMPAATDLRPSLMMACASTVAVVVPSPASSLVREATSFTICAPMFSNLSSSSISLATDTPSLVIRGAPNDLSSTTLRPLGPRVTSTASARVLTPLSMRLRASVSNLTSLAAIFMCSLNEWWFRLGKGRSGLHDAEDVAFLHDQQFFTVDLDLGAGPFAEQDLVAGFHSHCDQLAAVLAGTFANADDFAFCGFFL